MTIANRVRYADLPEISSPLTVETPNSAGIDIGLNPEFWQTPEPYHPARPLESAESRAEKGKAFRERTPREAHADWTPASDRPDPVGILLAGNAGRQENLVPLRMGEWRPRHLLFCEVPRL